MSGLSTFEAPGGLLFDTGEVVSELPNVSGGFELERLRDVTRFVLFTGAAAFALLSCLSARARTLAPRVVSLRDLCFAESGTPPLADEAIAIRGDQTRWTVISLRSGCQLLSQLYVDRATVRNSLSPVASRDYCTCYVLPYDWHVIVEDTEPLRDLNRH